jgi:RNA polymerase sigma factor (sigma-70 family)
MLSTVSCVLCGAVLHNSSHVVPRWAVEDSVSPHAEAELLRVAEIAASTAEVHGMDYEDRRQEAVVGIWSDLAKVLAADNPEALAYRIAQRHLIDKYRSALRHEMEIPVSQLVRPDDERETDARLCAKAARDARRTLRQSETRWVMDFALREAMAHLGRRDQVILRGYYGFHGDRLAFTELSKRCGGITVGYIKELKAKAIKHLGRLLSAPPKRTRTN